MATEGQPETPAATADDPAPAAVVETPAPVEGEAPAEPAPAEEPAEQTEEQKAAAEAKEAEIKVAAEKYAKELISSANKTMAAARRAEARTEAVKADNAKLTSELTEYKGFVQQMREAPGDALARIGFPTVKAFLDHIIELGGDKPAPTTDQRLDAFERAQRDREEREASAKADAAVEQAFAGVFAAVDKMTDRYDLVATAEGHDKLRAAITAYHTKHGEVPDAAIFLLADQVEKGLEARLAGSKRFGHAPAAKTGTTTTADPAAAARTSGKSLAGSATSGAPKPEEYSLDPEERRRQVNESLKRDGLI